MHVANNASAFLILCKIQRLQKMRLCSFDAMSSKLRRLDSWISPRDNHVATGFCSVVWPTFGILWPKFLCLHGIDKDRFCRFFRESGGRKLDDTESGRPADGNASGSMLVLPDCHCRLLAISMVNILNAEQRGDGRAPNSVATAEI